LCYESLSSCIYVYSYAIAAISGQCGSHGMPTRDGLSESRMADLIDGSENVLTYEDKDGDWMLVGDVPWE